MAKAQGKMYLRNLLTQAGTHKTLARTSTQMNKIFGRLRAAGIPGWDVLPIKTQGLRFSCPINTSPRGTCFLRITCPRSGSPLGSVVFS